MAPHRNKGSFYAVQVGRDPGVYSSWEECEKQVKGYQGAKYKKFERREDAEAFAYNRLLPTASTASTSATRLPPRRLETAMSVQSAGATDPSTSAQATSVSESQLPTSSAAAVFSTGPPQATVLSQPDESGTMHATSSIRVNPSLDQAGTSHVQQSPDWDVVYVTGICPKSTGVASIGVWWGPHDPRNLAERYTGKQTKKSAELLAVIRLLESTEVTEKPLLIRTDSEYFINCFKTWIDTWKDNNWLDSNDQPVKQAEMLQYISTYLCTRANFGQKIVVAYIRHRIGNAGMADAKELARRGASSDSIRQEPNWKEQKILLQFSHPLVTLGRSIAETEILGPNDVSDNVLLDFRARTHASPIRDGSGAAV